MKGITPVIATILLLLVTISIVGFAFVWFSRVTTTAGNQIENQTLNQISQASKTVRIEGGLKTTAPWAVSVRNTGTVTFPTAEVAVFLDGTVQTCSWSTASIAANSIATCTASAGACNPGSVIVVTSPAGSEDRRSC